MHGIDAEGKVVIRRQLKRRYVLAFFQKLAPCLVGIEACASSHHWSRKLKGLGHTVRLMPQERTRPRPDDCRDRELPVPGRVRGPREDERAWADRATGQAARRPLVIAIVRQSLADARFAPESGQITDIGGSLKGANRDLTRRSKNIGICALMISRV
jgi:hypothetical protein